MRRSITAITALAVLLLAVAPAAAQLGGAAVPGAATLRAKRPQRPLVLNFEGPSNGWKVIRKGTSVGTNRVKINLSDERLYSMMPPGFATTHNGYRGDLPVLKYRWVAKDGSEKDKPFETMQAFDSPGQFTRGNGYWSTELTIPGGARAHKNGKVLEVYFEATKVGSPQKAYDSDFGKNFRFDFETRVPVRKPKTPNMTNMIPL